MNCIYSIIEADKKIEKKNNNRKFLKINKCAKD